MNCIGKCNHFYNDIFTPGKFATRVVMQLLPTVIEQSFFYNAVTIGGKKGEQLEIKKTVVIKCRGKKERKTNCE